MKEKSPCSSAVIARKPEAAREWKVYFQSGYWKSHTNKSRAGMELVLNKQLIWGDEVWHIPSMYLCSRGFVVDYCVEIQPEKVKAFLDKWEPEIRGEKAISKEIRQQIESENPLEIDFHSHYVLNGRSIEQKVRHAISYVPECCLPENVKNPEETFDIIAHYHLDPEKAWVFHRQSCQWAAARKPKDIRSLSLTLERAPAAIQGKRWKNPSVGDVISFTHPISGTEHRLTVLAYEQKELSSDACADARYEFPTHHTAMTYRLEPALSDDAFAVRDCISSDPPRHSNKDPYEPDATCDAATAIIGGADGPTSIFLSPLSRCAEHIALSALHFEPTADVEWKMEFREKLMNDVQIKLIDHFHKKEGR